MTGSTRSSHEIPLSHYNDIHFGSRNVLSSAGDCVKTAQALQSTAQHVHEDEQLGWHGAISETIKQTPSRLEQLFLLVCRNLAAELLEQNKSNITAPGLAISSSKQDCRSILSGIPAWHGSAGVLASRIQSHLNIPVAQSCPATAACSTGLMSLLGAADLLEMGRAKHALVSCADSPLEELLLGAYKNMGVQTVVSPRAFSESHKATGFAPAEGAAACLLQKTKKNSQWKLRAGLRVGDAQHITRCEDINLMHKCLEALWVHYPQPDAIICHATGTAQGDQFEAEILNAGPWKNIDRLCYKPLIGHTLGASGLLELLASLELPAQRLWKLSFGFGGHIACVVVDKSHGNM